jgi:hypothetical protein
MGDVPFAAGHGGLTRIPAKEIFFKPLGLGRMLPPAEIGLTFRGSLLPNY